MIAGERQEDGRPLVLREFVEAEDRALGIEVDEHAQHLRDPDREPRALVLLVGDAEDGEGRPLHGLPLGLEGGAIFSGWVCVTCMEWACPEPSWRTADTAKTASAGFMSARPCLSPRNAS